MVQLSAGHQDAASKPHAQMDELVGHFGRYQLLIFMFKILIGITSAFNNLGVTFYAPSDYVGYSCARPTASSSGEPVFVNASARGGALAFTSISQTLSDFVQNDQRGLKHQDPYFDFDRPKNLTKQCKPTFDGLNQSAQSCETYDYNTGIWISTIIDEWDLVCDRSWLISMTQSLYMGGFIISYSLFGFISDRYGRWRSLILGASIEMLAGFGCAFAPSIKLFMLFRFLVGLGNAGRSSSSYLVMIEWAGPKYRMHVSTLGSLGWVIGYCLMPWITLYFLHFRHMQLFVCFYELVFILWLLRIPESPRWLLTHRKFDQAYRVLKMAAKFNGLLVKKSAMKKVSGHYSANLADMNGNSLDASLGALEPMTKKQFKVKFEHLRNMIMAKEFTANENKLTLFDLLKMRNLRTYLLILFFFWSSNSFIYYGIVLRVSDFGSRNLFLSFSVAGLFELPAVAFTIIFMKLMPRGKSNLLIFLLTGALCALQIPLKYYEWRISQQTTIMLAKLFNSCAFSCVLYQTMELFPTSIRQTAYSSCSIAGRIGSMMAPFIKELAEVTNQYVPIVIYTLMSLASAVLVNRLPETKGADLHDTLMEAEKFEGTDGKEPAETRSRKGSRCSALELASAHKGARNTVV